MKEVFHVSLQWTPIPLDNEKIMDVEGTNYNKDIVLCNNKNYLV